MAGFYIDRIACKSSEDSADDIYVVAFMGSSKSPFSTQTEVLHEAIISTVKIPWVTWQDFDDGEVNHQDVLLFPFSNSSVYVVALLERDSDNDLLNNKGEMLNLLRAQLTSTWAVEMGKLVASGISSPSSSQLAAAAKIIAQAMDGALGLILTWPVGDDDKIGAPKHVSFNGSKSVDLNYANSGGGSYRVRFKIA